MSLFTYKAQKTPTGRYYIWIMVGKILVAVGKKTHVDAETAMSEMRTAYENHELLKVANVTQTFMEIMGKDGKGTNVRA